MPPQSFVKFKSRGNLVSNADSDSVGERGAEDPEP